MNHSCHSFTSWLKRLDISGSARHFLAVLGLSKEHSAGARARHPGACRGGSWGAATAAVAGAGAFWVKQFADNVSIIIISISTHCINLYQFVSMSSLMCKWLYMQTWDIMGSDHQEWDQSCSLKLQLAYLLFKICKTFQNVLYGYMA